MYILDTDHATLLQRGDLRLNYRLRDLQPNQLATTIITYEEQLTGRLAVVRRARSGEARREAYYWLHKTLDFFCRLPVLTLDEKAAEIYEHFKAEKSELEPRTYSLEPLFGQMKVFC